MTQSTLKRPLLYSLVVSVILGAVLGVGLVLRDEWGHFEIRVVLTTIVIAVGSLCGLACDLSRTPRGRNTLRQIGLGMTLAAVGLLLIGIWTEPNSDWFWKLTAISCTFSLATVHVCLLSIVRLAGRFYWVYLLACQVIFGLASLIAVMIVFEIDDMKMIRFIIVVAIIDAALTLVIPLLHRISKSDPQPTELATPLEERNLLAIDDEIAQLKKRIADLEKLRGDLIAQSRAGSQHSPVP